MGQLTVKSTVISAETLDFDELAVKPAVNLSKNDWIDALGLN
jgi:hypothetical protein